MFYDQVRNLNCNMYRKIYLDMKKNPRVLKMYFAVFFIKEWKQSLQRKRTGAF